MDWLADFDPAGTRQVTLVYRREHEGHAGIERGPRGLEEGGNGYFQAGPTRVIVDGAKRYGR